MKNRIHNPEHTRVKERLLGMLDGLSTSTINLFGTTGRLDSRLTLDIENVAHAELASNKGRTAHKADFMVRKGRKETKGGTKSREPATD